MSNDIEDLKITVSKLQDQIADYETAISMNADYASQCGRAERKINNLLDEIDVLKDERDTHKLLINWAKKLHANLRDVLPDDCEKNKVIEGTQ